MSDILISQLSPWKLELQFPYTLFPTTPTQFFYWTAFPDDIVWPSQGAGRSVWKSTYLTSHPQPVRDRN